jgi:hypothetical protein
MKRGLSATPENNMQPMLLIQIKNRLTSLLNPLQKAKSKTH